MKIYSNKIPDDTLLKNDKSIFLIYQVQHVYNLNRGMSFATITFSSKDETSSPHKYPLVIMVIGCRGGIRQGARGGGVTPPVASTPEGSRPQGGEQVLEQE